MTIEVRDEDGGVRTFTLTRPPANAISVQMIEDLARVVGEARDDPAVRAVVLFGNERFFSAGLDLKEMAMGAAPKVAGFGYDDGVHALWTLPKPTVAAVDGHAIAGGAILALSCDFRITSRRSKRIGLNESQLGLSFPRGALEIVRHTLPASSLSRALLEAELHEPEAARELGFVHEVVDDAALRDRALALARKLGTYPSTAYADNKRLLLEPAVRRCAAETVEEREARQRHWSSPATIEAFLQRIGRLGKSG